VEEIMAERLLSLVDPASGERCPIVVEDPAMQEPRNLALRAAASDVTVLLEGESGAGKEVFARLIHQEGPRGRGPFVAVNCAALPRELLEGELFGHVRGAFTGAHRDRRGHFQVADGGTLLLDEIGEMSSDLQARLLRVMQDRQVQPVGSERPQRVDVRVIAATHRNLREEMLAGRFREDLYYRMRVLPIRIPPLRERPADLEPLAQLFARRYCGPRARVTAGALRLLGGHSWPGNVRELENTLQRAALLAGGRSIGADLIEFEPAPERGRVAASAAAAAGMAGVGGVGGVDDAGSGVEGPGFSLVDAERETIRRTLAHTRGNRTEAARALGISPRTLRYKLKRFRDAGRAV
jgi:two-component system response regulator FlrC